jgi:hypothetical protein
MMAFVLFLLPSHSLMRLQILGLFFLVLLPMNLFAQATPPPAAPAPTPIATPAPAKNTGKESQANPFLPLQTGPGGGQVPVEINSQQTRFEGGVAVAEGDVVVRYADVTIYCDYAEYARYRVTRKCPVVPGQVRIHRGSRHLQSANQSPQDE